MTSEAGFSSNWTTLNSTWIDRHQQNDVQGLAERRLFLDLVQTVAFKVLSPLIVAFGCVGNIINIVVLTRKSMKSSTNRYLTCLAVYDILYLVFAFSMILKHYNHIGAFTPLANFLHTVVLLYCSRRQLGILCGRSREFVRPISNTWKRELELTASIRYSWKKDGGTRQSWIESSGLRPHLHWVR